jgi:hypothetical protein
VLVSVSLFGAAYSENVVVTGVELSVCPYMRRIFTSEDVLVRFVNMSHYTPQRRLGERKYSSYSFSTSALDGGEWSA